MIGHNAIPLSHFVAIKVIIQGGLGCAHMAGKLIGIISDLPVVWCLNRLQVHGLNRTHMSQQQLLRCVVHALILKLTQEPTCFLTYLMMWMDPTQHAFTTLVSTHSKIGLLPSKLLLLLHH